MAGRPRLETDERDPDLPRSSSSHEKNGRRFNRQCLQRCGEGPGSLALPTSVSRAAGNNLTKSLAHDLAKNKIRVNAVCISLIKSAQWERRSEKGSLEELYNELGSKVPLGRVGEAEEYADLVAFLCSDRGAYITGTAINLDG